MGDVTHHQAGRAPRRERFADRALDRVVERLQVRPLRGCLERLDHHAMREQLVAQVRRLVARALPGLSRRAAHAQPAEAPHERKRAPAPALNLGGLPLVTQDREAPLAVSAGPQVGLPHSRLDAAVGSGERERDARLLLV